MRDDDGFIHDVGCMQKEIERYQKGCAKKSMRIIYMTRIIFPRLPQPRRKELDAGEIREQIDSVIVRGC